MAGGVRRGWRRLPPRWRRAVVAVLVLRLGVAAVALVAGGLLPGNDPVDVPPAAGFDGWEAAAPAEQGIGVIGAGVERFDALWYLALARDGYPDTVGVPQAAAFFPGYPLAVSVADRLLPGGGLLAATLVSLLAAVAGLAGVHRLVEDETGSDELARRALLAAAVWPAAYFLVAPYTEPLFLAASAWALVYLRTGRWWPAAALGVVTGLIRNVGVLLVVPAAVEVGRRWWRGHDRTPAAVAALAAAPAGLGLVLAHGAWRWGTWLAPANAQGGWQRELTAPWTTLTSAVDVAFSSIGAFASGYHTLDLLLFVPVLFAAGWLLRRAPAALSLYALAHVGVWLLNPFPARPLMSTARFALAVAPVFWAFGAWTAARARESAWLGVSAAFLGLQTLLFVNWWHTF